MIRVAVVSDTHGDLSNLSRVRSKLGPVDWLLHAGDHIQDVRQVALTLGVDASRVRAVVGNCDHPVKVPLHSNVEIDGIRILLTHGHLYSVKQTLQRLYYKAGEAGARVAVFGHSHVPALVEHGGILLFNPGSLSIPRSPGDPPSCGLIELNNDGTVTARHIYADNTWNSP